MMLEKLKDIKSTKKDLRDFGLVVGGVLSLIGGVLFWRGGENSGWLLAAGVALIVSGLLVPAILRPLHKPWIALSLALGWVMTRVILTILFFLMIMPMGLIARALGKRPLMLEFKDPSKQSWWNSRDEHKDGSRHYERQF